MTSSHPLANVVAIPVTPFDESGAVDEGTYSALLGRLTAAGVRVLTPNGNTSEFYALSPAERRRLLVLTASAMVADTVIVAGVGHDIDTAISDGRHAVTHGAQYLMVHQPTHPYVSGRGWVDYHVRIAAGVPDAGIVLYVRNPRVSARMIASLLDAAPNLAGIKFAVPDPVAFDRVRSDVDAPELAWITGLAEPYALSYSVHGAVGFTSGLVTVNPALSLELHESLRTGDLERAHRLSRLIDSFELLRADNQSANNVSVIKEALAQLDLCRRTVRPPSSELDAADRVAVADILARWSRDYDLLAGSARIGVVTS